MEGDGRDAGRGDRDGRGTGCVWQSGCVSNCEEDDCEEHRSVLEGAKAELGYDRDERTKRSIYDPFMDDLLVTGVLQGIAADGRTAGGA